MNLLRRQSLILGWNFVHVSRHHFSGIKPHILDKIRLIASPIKYYNELMKEVHGDSKGYFSLDSSYIMLMADKSKTPEDIEATIAGYYNFLGHRTKFAGSVVDRLVRKAIECNNPKAAHDILYNHNFLLYYPNPQVLDEMMAYYRKNKAIEDAKAFFPQIIQRRLIKFNPGFFEQAIFLSNEAEDYTLAFSAYRAAQRLGLRISTKAFLSLINSMSKLAAKEPTKKSPVFSSVFATAPNYKLRAEDFFELSLSQISRPADAIRVLELLSETNIKLGEKTTLVKNTEANQEYFRKIYNAVRANRDLYGRLTRALKSIQQKYAENAFDKELYTLVQEVDKKANEPEPAQEAPKAEEANKEEQTQQNA